jgi:CheY-like chemotaxis protein
MVAKFQSVSAITASVLAMLTSTDLGGRRQATAQPSVRRVLVDARMPDCDHVEARNFDRRFEHAAPHAKIVRFHDATKALRFVFLAESTPKLVLLELGHPLDRGLHVIERLRSNPRMSAIPVIVLTATRDQSAVEASHALGANGFITKPDTREEYCSQVKAIVERWLH